MRPYSLIVATLVGLYCCCCMIQTAMSAPAPGTSGTSSNKPQNSGNSRSPQLLYMKTLHDRIKGAKVKMGVEEEIKDKDTSGTLIATSFEVTGDVTGAGENAVEIQQYCMYSHCAVQHSNKSLMPANVCKYKVIM